MIIGRPRLYLQFSKEVQSVRVVRKIRPSHYLMLTNRSSNSSEKLGLLFQKIKAGSAISFGLITLV